jgi:uncharacterized protein (TIGR02646 family)
MIRIHKPTNAPAPNRLLLGVTATSENCAKVVAEPHLFKAGTKYLNFDKVIYSSVKSQLKIAQHDKCCYCEGKFLATSSGDVEHFRPKKGAKQDYGKPVEHPGYYWLAYSWSNLYFSCEICNRSCKKSYFPLSDPSKRARFHSDNINDEDPLILDPSGIDDPREHIKFRGEVAEGKTPKGRQTVKTLKLDRLTLNEERLTEANRIRLLKKTVEMLEANQSLLPQSASILADARKYLANAVKPDAEYSAMAQDLLI